MNGSMDIEINRIPSAISVPAKAIFTRDGKPVVFVNAKDGYHARESPDSGAQSGRNRQSKESTPAPWSLWSIRNRQKERSQTVTWKSVVLPVVVPRSTGA